jgi:hypothetical protein
MQNFFVSLSLLFTLASSTALATEKAAEKEWTLLVFLNGNNNLDIFGAKDINEMEMEGSDSKVDVVVQWASLNRRTVQRLHVQKDQDPNTVTSPVIEHLGSVDMGSWKNLRDFIIWGATRYPSKKLFVDVWNHGSGWHRSLEKTRDISSDDLTHNKITTVELGRALREASSSLGRRIDIYGSDACLMGMIEVANEVADSVDTYVGSQELEPGPGWHYGDWLKAWKATDQSAEAVATALVTTYVKSYQGGSQGTKHVTLSAYRLSGQTQLNQALAQLKTELIQTLPTSRPLIQLAIQNSIKFFYSDYVDLGHWLSQIEALQLPGIQKTTIDGVRAALKNYVFANGVTEFYAQAEGVSIWLPSMEMDWTDYAQLYRGLSFDQSVQWSQLLQGLMP